MLKSKALLNLTLGGLFCATALFNARAETAGGISMELNKVEPAGENCVLTFVVSSDLKTNIDKLSYEFVIFDADMKVERMTAFDFRALEAGKLRVRQFQLPNTRCDNLGRLLINDAAACTGKQLDKNVCSGGLKITNKTELEFRN